MLPCCATNQSCNVGLLGSFKSKCIIVSNSVFLLSGLALLFDVGYESI